MPKRQWVEPKTDWSETDYFNLEDYRRITGNIHWLWDASYSLFPYIAIVEMPDKKGYSDLFFASDMNAIETNLEIINSKTYGYDIGDTLVYTENGQTPTFDEFNRIESATLMIHDQLIEDGKYLWHLPIRLGNEDHFVMIGGGHKPIGEMTWAEASEKTWNDYSEDVWGNEV